MKRFSIKYRKYIDNVHNRQKRRAEMRKKDKWTLKFNQGRWIIHLCSSFWSFQLRERSPGSRNKWKQHRQSCRSAQLCKSLDLIQNKWKISSLSSRSQFTSIFDDDFGEIYENLVQRSCHLIFGYLHKSEII